MTGENTDTIVEDGAPVQKLGALGGGYAPDTTEGLGPAISEMHDNGALDTDHFTIDSTQDDLFHGSSSSWLPVQTATEQTGLTEADTGGGLSDSAYLSDMGKKGPSTASVPGSSLVVTDDADNDGAGERFAISTASGALLLLRNATRANHLCKFSVTCRSSVVPPDADSAQFLSGFVRLW